MEKIVPCLWYDHDAEEAANFYVGLLPDSRVDAIHRSPADNLSGPAGAVLLVEFTLAGRPYQGLNGGPIFSFTEAVSFVIHCADQAEVDRLWDALIANGGKASQCGWLKDRWGLSWQIVPVALGRMMSSPDKAASKRAMEAMLKMQKLDIAALERAFAGEVA